MAVYANNDLRRLNSLSTMRLQSINAARQSSSSPISILRQQSSTQKVSQQLSRMSPTINGPIHDPTLTVGPLRKRQRQPTDHEAEFGLAVAKRLRVSSTVTGKVAGPTLGHEVKAVCTWHTEAMKCLKDVDEGPVKSQQSSPTFERANLIPDFQFDKATHTNYEGRPWQRLVKKSSNGSKWLQDVQTRPGTSSKSHELSDELSWTTVHASTRNRNSICDSQN